MEDAASSNGRNGRLKREVSLLIIAAAVSIVVGVSSSYVATYTRLAVLETTVGTHAEKLEAQKDELRTQVVFAATEREKLQAEQRRSVDMASHERDKIISMLTEARQTVSNIDKILARIEAKLEK